MGTFRVRLEVAGLSRERFEPVEALVDTGSTYTVLPRSLLDAVTLEEFLLAPDPSSGQLVPVRGLMMRAA